MRDGRASTWLRLGLAALLAAPVAVGLVPVTSGGPAQAALGGVTDFEIDGNTVPGTGSDWYDRFADAPELVAVENDLNFTGTAVVPDNVGSADVTPTWLPNCPDTTDSLIRPSSNISDPDWTDDTITGSQVNSKQDICQSFFSYDVIESGARAGHIVAYIGFTRRVFNGDGSYYFLLTRGPNPDVRVAGDIVVEVDYSGQGDPQGLRLAVWEDNGGVLSLGAYTDIGVSNPNVELSPVKYFAEAALDLTALGVAANAYELATPEQCSAIGYGRILSRTGNSPGATLKDDGQPAALDFDVCGSVTIRKVLTAAVPSAETFPISLDAPTGVTIPDSDPAQVLVAGGATSAQVVFDSVPPRAGELFSVSEDLSGALGDRWNLESIECISDNGTPDDAGDDRVEDDAATFELLAGESVVCTVTNSPAPATVNVTKVVEGPATDAEWDIDLTGQPTQQISADETISFVDVPAGQYTLSETDPANEPGQPPYDADQWSCSINDGAAVVTAGASTQLSLDPGDVADCVITNVFVPVPVIEVTKTASPTSFPEADGDVTYSVTVANNGPGAVTLTSLTDDVQLNGGSVTTLDLAIDAAGSAANGTVTANSCDTDVAGATIPAGGQVTCSFTVAYTGMDAGDVVDDVVEAAGVDVFGRPVSDDDDATVTVTDVLPDVSVDKRNDDAFVVQPGGDVTFFVTVTNPADAVEPVTITSLTDRIGDGAPFSITAPVSAPVVSTTCELGIELAPGESYDCSFVATVTGEPGEIVRDTVEVIVVDNEGNPASDDDPADTPVFAAPPVIDVTKTDDGASVPEPGGVVTYTVGVTNDSLNPVTITSMTDAVRTDPDASYGTPFDITEVGGLVVATTCDIDADDDGTPDRVLQPGESYECEFDLTLEGNAGTEYDDQVVVTGVDPFENEVSDTARAQTPIVGAPPAVTITKTPSVSEINEPGGQVTFTFVITNTSGPTDPLTITSLVDSDFGDLTEECALAGVELAPGASVECEITRTLAGSPSTPHNNVATVNAVDDEGAPASDSDDATVAFVDVLPSVEVVKTASPTSVPESGGQVTFTFTVTNTSVESVVLTSLVDDVFGDLNGLGTCATGGTLAVGGSYTCQYTTFLEQLEGETSHTNIVTGVVQDDEGNTASDSDPEVVTFELIPPTVTITKTDGDATVNAPGGVVTYTLQITNTSYEAVTVTSLTDAITYEIPAQVVTVDLLDAADMAAKGVTGSDCAAAVAGGLEPGESVSCSFDLSLSGDAQVVRDVAEVVVIDDDGQTGSDSDDEATPIVAIIDVDAFSPVCVADAPYIEYTIVPIGFTPQGGATLTFIDVNGVEVGSTTVSSLSGRVLYPGAAVDEDGNAIDWPGWKFEGGLWVPDPSDAIVREGLTIRVEVNPTAIAEVTYPPATSECADPEQPQADLAIVKSASVSTAERGSSFNWLLNITNNGPDPATNVVVSDTVPASLVVTGVTSADFTCSASGNTVTCTRPSLAVGASGSVTVAVSVPVDAAAGAITNVGSVQAVTPDPNLTNNSDDASVTVPPVQSQPPTPQLPQTGSPVDDVVKLASLLLAGGLVVLVMSRRRRIQTP